MSQHLINYDDAHTDLLACASFLAEEIADKNQHSEALEKLVPIYLERGEVDLAAELANTIDFAPKRESLLAVVASKCAEQNDDEYALQLVDAIEDSTVKQSALEKIIIELAAHDKIEKALSLARNLAHNSMVFGIIAQERNRRGDESGALDLIEEIDEPAEQIAGLEHIALEKYKAGETERASQLLEDAYLFASDIDYPPNKISRLHSVSADFAEIGRRDRSIEILSEIQRIAEKLDAVDRDNRLSEVSLALFEAGSVDLADRALDLVRDKTQIASALVGYAREYWKRDERADALDALREAEQILRSQGERETRDSLARFKTFTVITTQFAEFGEAETAVNAAESIQFDSERNSALAQIARILAAQGKDEAAHQTLRLIDDGETRSFALLGIADAHYRAENLSKAVEYVDEAAESAEDAENDLSRLSLTIAAANRYAVFGADEKAHQAAAEILREIAKLRSPASQSNALADLSEGFRQANLELNQTEKQLLQTILD